MTGRERKEQGLEKGKIKNEWKLINRNRRNKRRNLGRRNEN